MAQPEQTRKSVYQGLRADYDAAFARLRREESWLQSMAQLPSADKAVEDLARRRVDEAMATYRECRNKLTGFLASLQPGGKAAASADAHLAEVRALAYHLSEEVGRPLSNPDEQWYRAERLLRDAR